MRDSSVKSYVPAFEMGKAITGYQVAEVLKSKSSEFPEKSIVYGMFPFQQYHVSDEKTLKAYRAMVLKVITTCHIYILIFSHKGTILSKK